MKQFYIGTDNSIYVGNDGGFFLRTPFGEYYRKELDSTFSKIKESEAKHKINEAWDSYDKVWEWDGKQYTTSSDVPPFSNKVPKHKGFCFDYKLVSFQGKLYWMCAECNYYPKMEITKFNPSNQEPDINMCENVTFFVDCSHIKPIYCITDKKFI